MPDGRARLRCRCAIGTNRMSAVGVPRLLRSWLGSWLPPVARAVPAEEAAKLLSCTPYRSQKDPSKLAGKRHGGSNRGTMGLPERVPTARVVQALVITVSKLGAACDSWSQPINLVKPLAYASSIRGWAHRRTWAIVSSAWPKHGHLEVGQCLQSCGQWRNTRKRI